MTIDNFIAKHWKKLVVAGGLALALHIGYTAVVASEERKAEPVKVEPFRGDRYNNINIKRADGRTHTLECENPKDAPGSCTDYGPMTVHR